MSWVRAGDRYGASKGGVLRTYSEGDAVLAGQRGSEQSRLVGAIGFHIACSGNEYRLQITRCGTLQLCNYLLILSFYCLGL